MNHDSAGGQPWEKYRPYLRMLAEMQLDPRLNAKVDLSGVVQQTLLEAFREAPALPDAEQKLKWLRRVLAHNLTDEIRKFRTDKRLIVREMPLNEAVEQSSLRLEAWLKAETSSPSHHLQREEKAVLIACALQRLPETQRQALVLQHWHGMPISQIAEHMGKSITAVAGLLKRGLQSLRDELDELKV